MLSPRDTAAFDRLTDILSTRRGLPVPALPQATAQDFQDGVAKALAVHLQDGNRQPLIGALTVQSPQGASAEQVIHSAMRHVRMARLRTHAR